MQQILDERMDAIHTQTRQSEPLREKLSFIEKFIVKLERNKDHFHAKMKEYQKTVEDMKTILAKKQALLEQQAAKAVNWSKDEIETERKPEAIHRDSEFDCFRFKLLTFQLNMLLLKRKGHVFESHFY